jgi:hypothetical protein
MLRALPGLLVLFVSCNSNFEKQSQIARVRVLGVRAEPAELLVPAAGPPLPVQLDALAVAPDGRPVSVQFAFCRPFTNVYASTFECPGRDGVDLSDGGLSLLDPQILALLGAAGDGSAGNPLSQPAFAAQLQAGVPFQVGYLATDGADDPEGLERGYATITAQQTDTPNHNPGLLDVQLDGVSLEGQLLEKGVTVTLTPVVSDGSFEIYAAAGGPAQETLSISWFASGDAQIGSLRSVLTPEAGASSAAAQTTLVTPSSSGSTTVWVVARDGRGGTSWLARTFSTR